MSTSQVDLVVVGAGIVGLAHAVDAVARGLSVVVVERDERAVGASVRNFGHVCATAQEGRALEYALAARDAWVSLGRKAGFEVSEAGTVVLARTDAEAAVLEEFAAARGSEQVQPRGAAALPFAVPGLVAAALLPLAVRLDPRAAVLALAAWLAEEGVQLRWRTSVTAVEPGLVHTSRGPIPTRAVVHCVGDDVDRLYPELAEEWQVRRCRLQMMEVAPPADVRIPSAVLTGTSMLRYAGLAGTPSAADVRAELEAERPELLETDMNLMLTQRPDGSIVLGDTHRYDVTLTPFDEESDAELVLREGARLFGAPLTVRRRWRGVYAHSPRTDFLVAAPHPDVRVVSVTSGIGMTTALGLAPTVLDDLL